MKSIFLVILGTIVYCVDFEANMAQEIYEYAQPTYCATDAIPNWSCTPCQKHPKMQEIQVFFNNSHDAQGYCGYDAGNDRVIIAIRGTVDIENWLQDADFIKTHYGCDGCEVHRGFHRIYEDLANNLLACAYTLKSNHPTAKVIVTGHSLGAAQATLASLEINQLITKVDYFYVFGCPRVGNTAFSSYIESQLSHLYIARLVHWKDIFQHTPTREMGFSHYGHEVFYDQTFGSFKLCGKEDSSCADQFHWPWQWTTKDHLFYYNTCAGCEEKGCDKYKR